MSARPKQTLAKGDKSHGGKSTAEEGRRGVIVTHSLLTIREQGVDEAAVSNHMELPLAIMPSSIVEEGIMANGIMPSSMMEEGIRSTVSMWEAKLGPLGLRLSQASLRSVRC